METPPSRRRNGLRTNKANPVIPAIITACVTFAVAILGFFVQTTIASYQSETNRALAERQNQAASTQLAMKLRQTSIQIAVGILSRTAPRNKDGQIEPFDPAQQELRRWAIQLLNENAEIKIPEKAESALIYGKTAIRPYGTDWGYSDYGTDWGYTDYGTTYDTFHDYGSTHDRQHNYGSTYEGGENPNRQPHPPSPPTDAPQGDR